MEAELDGRFVPPRHAERPGPLGRRADRPEDAAQPASERSRVPARVPLPRRRRMPGTSATAARDRSRPRPRPALGRDRRPGAAAGAGARRAGDPARILPREPGVALGRRLRDAARSGVGRRGARPVRPVARPVLPARGRPSEAAPARRRGRRAWRGRTASPTRPTAGRSGPTSTSSSGAMRRPAARTSGSSPRRAHGTASRDWRTSSRCWATPSGPTTLYAEAADEITAKELRSYAWVETQRGPPAPAPRPARRGGAHYERAAGGVLRLLAGRRGTSPSCAPRRAASTRRSRSARTSPPAPARPELAQAAGDLHRRAGATGRGAGLARAGAGRVPRVGAPRRGAVPPPPRGVLRRRRGRRRRRRALGRAGSRAPAALRHRGGAGVGAPPRRPARRGARGGTPGRSRRVSATRMFRTITAQAWRRSMTGSADGSPNAAGTLEARLALVCYGGVSLAIYMSGITREIQELVTGSARAPGAVPRRRERPASTRSLLDALEQAASDRGDPHRIQVGVDIVAGTSAGGINGICLDARPRRRLFPGGDPGLLDHGGRLREAARPGRAEAPRGRAGAIGEPARDRCSARQAARAGAGGRIALGPKSGPSTWIRRIGAARSPATPAHRRSRSTRRGVRSPGT